MFDEKEHPRDDDGTFTDKETDGKYYRQNASYGEILKIGKIPDYSKYKNRIQSKVFDKISSVRSLLDKKKYLRITVYDLNNVYKVKLYGSEKDYEFEILKIDPIE